MGVEVSCPLTMFEVPGMNGGTSDFVIVAHNLKKLYVIDYKHAEVWRQRGERVIGNFGSGIGDSRQQSGFTGIRQSYQADMGY